MLDGKWGFIDKTGAMVIKNEYDNDYFSILSFKNGLVKVKQGDQDCYINKQGDVVWSSGI